ncbi:hypothetical protein QQ045_033423 [Rhodiola kirilowii]
MMMNTNSSNEVVVAAEKKTQPPSQTDPAPNCPRCDSENTKFCYYNNYSLSQPRYFCKSCRRYWTKGGALRNVPVGGGCRKNKRSTKRAFYTPYNHLENNAMIMSSSSNNNYPLSNFSSPLSYDDSSSATGDSLSMAFARLQKQCDGDHGHLGFEFWNQNQPALSTDLAFLGSNGFERQIINCNSQRLYNLGFENVGEQNYLGHSYSQRPLVPNEDFLSLINGAELLSAAGGEAAGYNLISGPMKLESMEVNRMILEVNNGGASADNHNNNSDNNVVLGNEVGNGCFGLASPAFWPNLFNSTA